MIPKRGMAVPASLADLQEINLLDFNPDTTGNNSASAALAGAISQLPTYGGIIRTPPGSLLLTETWICGDAADFLTLSTKSHIYLVGGGSGTANSTLTGVTNLLWSGGIGTMVRFRGQESFGMHGFRLLGGGNSGAATGLLLQGCSAGIFYDLLIGGMRPRTTQTGEASGAIVMTNASSNTFFGVTCVCQQGSTGVNGSTCLRIGTDPGDDGTTGNSQNAFIRCNFRHSNTVSTSYGIHLRNADNNAFMLCNVEPNGGETSGSGVFFQQATDTKFPMENCFVNSAIQSNPGGVGGTGGNKFDPYPTSDGETIPVIPNVTFVTYDHTYNNGDGATGAVSFMGSRVRLLPILRDSGLTFASGDTKASFTTEAAFSTTRTIPAGDLNIFAARLRVKAQGTYGVTGTPTYTFRVKVNAVEVAKFAVVPVSDTTGTWIIDQEIYTRATGASGALQKGIAVIQIGTVSEANEDSGFTSQDVTGAMVVSITVACSASSASNTVGLDTLQVVPDAIDQAT